MKKLIFLALLCLSFVAAHAAPSIINKTHCSLQLTLVCYDPLTCNSFPCGPVVPIPAGATIPLPPPCGCPVPQLQGYTICYSPGFPACAGICTNVSDPAGGPCANFPLASVLPPCPACGGVPLKVFWDAAGNLVIQ